MRTLKGFVNVASFIDNTSSTTAILGEMSAWSKTYSKDILEYTNSAVNGYTLLVTKSVDPVLGIVAPDSVLTNMIIAIVHNSIAFSNSNIRPLSITSYKADINAAFTIQNLATGPFVDNGVVELPSWISWDYVGAQTTTVKIWLADTSFNNEYDEYDITVTPPIATIDDFFLSSSVVGGLVAANPINVLLDTVNTNKGNAPETFLRIYNFDYVPAGGTAVISTHWPLLIYSKYGDNIDAVKNSITSYILANSTHTVNEWVIIFPTLFKRTEFMILPRWDKISIPNLSVQSGLNSSIGSPTEELAFTKAQIPSYSPAHIDTNLEVFPVLYKTLKLCAVGGVDNVGGAFKISSMYQDYLPVGTGTLDFNRMTAITQNWVLLLERMIVVAEIANSVSSLPSDMRKVTRDGHIYVTALYNNVQYLVSAKLNYGV